MRRILRPLWLGPLALLLCVCAPASTASGAEWSLPFPDDSDNGCATISTPFSVENPWDWAHEGLDFACLADVPVYAVQSGRIVRVERVDIGGQDRFRVAIELDSAPLRVEYINLSHALVDEGDTVAAGEEIGLTALGLHLAVWDESQARYVDPGLYLSLPKEEAARD
jgi:murein DD-endopeptidase MepM/ murein hydrolase activator NlpD